MKLGKSVGKVQKRSGYVLREQRSSNYANTFNQLGKIKNKKVRKFYEQQNERLNDWVEVDALVMAIGEDIIDSMNPDAGKSIRPLSSYLWIQYLHMTDHDGIIGMSYTSLPFSHG